MSEINEQPISEQENNVEVQEAAGYSHIISLAQWIQNSYENKLTGNELEEPKVALTIAEEVSKCLPIEKGSGNATIAQQLEFWATHQDEFEKFLKRRVQASRLLTYRKELINHKNNNEANLNIMNVNLHYFAPEDHKQQSKEIKKYRKKRDALLQKTESLTKSIVATDAEFEEDKQMRNFLTSHLDCKLPAIVTGQILLDLGWNVSLVCANHPEHPSIMASKLRSSYMISFNGNPSDFKSLPDIREDIHPRHLTTSKHLAIQNGFITEDEPWPLPFNETSFKKFDDWYVEHVEKPKSASQRAESETKTLAK